MVRADRVGGSVPSYTHCLSCIGQYLNQQRARMVTVAEVDIGYMVFFYPGGKYAEQRVLIVPFADLLDLTGAFAPAARGRKGGILRDGMSHDKRHPLLPHGYAAVFKALGTKFDQRGATGVTICDGGTALYVEYWVDNATFVVRDQRRQAVSHHQFDSYDTAGLQRIQETVRRALEQEAARYLGALRLNNHDFVSTIRVALLQEDQGDYAGAEEIIARVAVQVPEHAEVHYHLARLAYIRGDRHLALRAIRTAVTLRPDIGAVQDLYGRILLQHHQTAAAIAAFELAVTQAPDMLLHPYHLAKAYETQGRTQEAATMMGLVSLPHAAPAWDTLDAHLSEQLPPTPLAEAGVAAAAQREVTPDRSAAASSIQAPAEALVAATPSMESQSPDASSLLTTTFDPIETLVWAQPDRQLPSLDAPGMPETATPAGESSGDLAPPAPSQTLSQRMRMAGIAGTGSLATRVPPPVTTEPPPASRDLPALPDEMLPALEPAPQTNATLPAVSPFTMSVFGDTLPSLSLDAMPSLETLPPQDQPGMPQAHGATTHPYDDLETPPRHDPPSATSPATALYGAPIPPLLRPVGTSGQTPREEQGTVEIAAEILLIQRALEVEPNRADLHRKLGFLLARQGRAAEAATAFRQALECSRMSL